MCLKNLYTKRGLYKFQKHKAWGENCLTVLDKIKNLYPKWIRSEDSVWRTMDGGSWHCTGGSDKDHPQEKEIQKGKMVVRVGLTNGYEKKRSERERRKVKIYPSECRVPKNSKGR